MTIARKDREENHRAAFRLMIEQLGDRAIDTSLFDPAEAQFEGAVLRTTWEELERFEYVDEVTGFYRLTAKEWLVGVQVSGLAQSEAYVGRLGHLFATMKSHVKGRKASAVVDLPTLARESGEPEGWIFNVIDSRATTSEESRRTGATWFENERARAPRRDTGGFQPGAGRRRHGAHD